MILRAATNSASHFSLQQHAQLRTNWRSRSGKGGYKKLRREGVAGFFRPPVPQPGHKLTPQRLQEVQEMLDAGMEFPVIGSELGVLPNTIHKAIRAGRLKKKSPVGLSTPLAAANAPEPSSVSTQGTRSVADGEAVMGGGNHPLHGTGGHRSRRFGASRNAF